MEIEQPQGYFTRILELLKALIDDSRHQWENKAIFMKSLGCRASTGRMDCKGDQAENQNGGGAGGIPYR